MRVNPAAAGESPAGARCIAGRAVSTETEAIVAAAGSTVKFIPGMVAGRAIPRLASLHISRVSGVRISPKA